MTEDFSKKLEDAKKGMELIKEVAGLFGNNKKIEEDSTIVINTQSDQIVAQNAEIIGLLKKILNKLGKGFP